MKIVIGAAALALAAGFASADVYNDAAADLFDNGLTNLDILSVTVTNDASFLHFDIQVGDDLDATVWGKYIVGIDTGANAGDNSVDPGSWNRNVDWGRGITDFLGTWVDDGGSGAGGELRQFDGVSWGLTDATYLGGGLITGSDADHATGLQRVSVSLGALGLSVGDTIDFDVFTTGNGADPGVDHLSRGDAATPGWGDQSVAGDFLSYTIVPAPGTAALLGLGGLAAVRRRR